MPTGAGQEPASFSWRTWPGSRQRSQEPAHHLCVNSSPVGSWQRLLGPFPCPLPRSPAQRKRVSQLVGGVSIPHLCPLGERVGVTEGGPQRIFVLQTTPPPPATPAGAGKAPGFLECEAPISPSPSRCLCHSLAGPTSAELSQGSRGADRARKGALWALIPTSWEEVQLQGFQEEENQFPPST